MIVYCSPVLIDPVISVTNIRKRAQDSEKITEATVQAGEKKLEQAAADTGPLSRPSLYIRFAESVKGLLYIILAVSIFAAVIMGQSGLILTIEDIIDSLIIARLGNALIIIIAIALFIYGLKNLRIMK